MLWSKDVICIPSHPPRPSCWGDVPHFHYQIILTSTLTSSMCEFFCWVEEKWKPSLRSAVLQANAVEEVPARGS